MSQPISQQRGFTLIESMVAVVLLAIAALAMGGVLVRASRTATAAGSTIHATAALATEVGRMNALPYAQLTAGTTCATVSTQPYPHTRCTTVTVLNANQRQVTIILTPSGNPLLRPDTVRFERSKTGGNTALNTP